MNRTLLAALCIWAAGCATSDTVRSEPMSQGATRTYAHSFDQVVGDTRSAIKDVGLELKSEERDQDGTGTIFVAQRGVTGWSWGEVVRVWVKPVGGGTMVRVLPHERAGVYESSHVSACNRGPVERLREAFCTTGCAA